MRYAIDTLDDWQDYDDGDGIFTVWLGYRPLLSKPRRVSVVVRAHIPQFRM
jgi:hypothetical protein